ncbi:MAG: outer membrane beta-barrel protein [Gammaproteobacteria bacterium]|nr:outer membrane beta-barrel protein [Gammaproteobacteria bacterium]
MRTMHFAAAVASALALSTSASAGFFDLTLAPYVGGNLGQSTSDISCPAGISCDDSDTAWKIYGGLEINEYISMEVGYIDLGEATFTGTQAGTRETNGMTTAIVGTYAISPSFTLSGRGGMNFLNTEVNGTIAATPTNPTNNNTGDTDVVWSFGVGAQYNITPSVGLRLDWERFFEAGSSDYNGGTGEADIDLFSAGVVYKF